MRHWMLFLVLSLSLGPWAVAKAESTALAWHVDKCRVEGHGESENWKKMVNGERSHMKSKD